MKRCLIFTVLAGSVALSTSSQVLRPIDPSKRADDINNKNLTLPSVDFQALPQNSRKLSISPLSNKQPQLNDAQTKQVEFKSVEFSTVCALTLSKTNVTPRTADVTDKVHETKDVPSTKAPITDRQIRPLTPKGEEELKKQLNQPH
jgi:hypothetical protein